MGKFGFTFCLLAGLYGGWATPQAEAAIERLQIEAVNGCDEFSLTIVGSLGVIGRQSGCGSTSFLLGSEFTTASREEGLRVYYFDTLTFRFLKVEILQTGFRANKYYVYDAVSNRLQYFDDWQTITP